MAITVTKRSPLTGKDSTRSINATREQYAAWQRGQYIQHAMPDASPDDREFLLSGYTPEDWDKLFPPEPEAGA